LCDAKQRVLLNKNDGLAEYLNATMIKLICTVKVKQIHLFTNILYNLF